MLRRWATASRKLREEAMVVVVVVVGGWISSLLVVDVKGREGVFGGVIVSSEFEGWLAVLAREAVNGLMLYARRRRPLRSAGSSSGAVIAMARTRIARRNAVFVRITFLSVAKHNRMA